MVYWRIADIHISLTQIIRLCLISVLWRAFLGGFSRRHSGLCREKRRQKTPSQDGKQAKIFNEWSNERFGFIA